MPRTAIDYSKCCIYKIEHIDDEKLVYVGHTTNFIKRKDYHRSSFYNEKDTNYNCRVYKMMRDNGGWEMFRMIEIEKYPCNDKREAEKRENDIMKELKSSMNSIRSFISEDDKKEWDKEYYFKNKERLKKYRDNNKDKICEKHKEYYEIKNKLFVIVDVRSIKMV